METNENIYETENGNDLSNAILLINSANGIYMGQAFAESYADNIVRSECPQITDEDIQTLLAGPDDEFYLEAEIGIFDNAVIKLPGSEQLYRIVQEDDLWAIPMC